MENINRREFIKRITLSGAGITLLSSSALLAACSSNTLSKDAASTTTAGNDGFAVVRVSSDLHISQTPQRLAFSIFDSNKQIVAKNSNSAILISPSKKEQTFKDVVLREKGIPGQGIYSIDATLNEIGFWQLKTNHQSKPLELNFEVAENNIAPSMGDACPNVPTPTDSNQLDAKVLCSRFDGNCGLHSHSVDSLLETKKPFVVLFATPARCQSTYCGPVLDLALNEAKNFDINIIHVEIYKDEVSNALLDSVSAWNLPSEPWMFGVTGEGKISKRLDGAFDQSEIADLIKDLL